MVLPKDTEKILSVQIETTSRCNLDCTTCLKPAYSDDWQEQEMTDSLFHRILRQIPPKTTVHLQGWGEPLLHPATLEHIRLLKAHGCIVSFTTNGTIMDRNMAASLVETGLDGLTFSMAGSSTHVHDKLRGAGSFNSVRESIRLFNAVRNQYKTSIPKVAVSYLVTPETVRELPAAVAWCRSRGVDAFVSVHLTQAGCRSQEEMQFLLSKNECHHYRLIRLRSHLAAVFSKMRLELDQFHPTLTPVCGKNPINNLFISVNGNVSPCVFLSPPVDREIAWRYKGESCLQTPVVFGNVHNATLAEIWEQQEYHKFRTSFEIRKEFHDSKLSGIGCSLAGSAQLDAAIAAIKEFFSENPPPGACRCCAKIDGY